MSWVSKLDKAYAKGSSDEPDNMGAVGGVYFAINSHKVITGLGNMHSLEPLFDHGI